MQAGFPLSLLFPLKPSCGIQGREKRRRSDNGILKFLLLLLRWLRSERIPRSLFVPTEGGGGGRDRAKKVGLGGVNNFFGALSTLLSFFPLGTTYHTQMGLSENRRQLFFRKDMTGPFFPSLRPTDSIRNRFPFRILLPPPLDPLSVSMIREPKGKCSCQQMKPPSPSSSRGEKRAL